MLGLPTLMVADNPYYAQKAIGLLDAFGQPPEFAIDSAADPPACAEMVAATAIGGEPGRKLRLQLALDASGQRRRRAAAEADLLARIAGTDADLDEAGSRRAETEAEADRRVRAAERRSGAAEERANIAEVHAANLQAQLATLIGSTSWRLTGRCAVDGTGTAQRMSVAASSAVTDVAAKRGSWPSPRGSGIRSSGSGSAARLRSSPPPTRSCRRC